MIKNKRNHDVLSAYALYKENHISLAFIIDHAEKHVWSVNTADNTLIDYWAYENYSEMNNAASVDVIDGVECNAVDFFYWKLHVGNRCTSIDHIKLSNDNQHSNSFSWIINILSFRSFRSMLKLLILPMKQNKRKNQRKKLRDSNAWTE